jgi:hypothetical protein
MESHDPVHIGQVSFSFHNNGICVGLAAQLSDESPPELVTVPTERHRA